MTWKPASVWFQEHIAIKRMFRLSFLIWKKSIMFLGEKGKLGDPSYEIWACERQLILSRVEGNDNSFGSNIAQK
jgi:hypothetical protein